MSEPVWLDAELILALYPKIVEVSGGAVGVRDEGLLRSALARAENRYAYEGVADLPELAATYAVAMAKNHPFVDGNKRAALLCLGQFLEDNGMRLIAEPLDVAAVILKVAAGELDIGALAAWVHAHSRRA